MNMPSYQDTKSHCGDKTVVRSSYLCDGISYTGKMTSLFWIRALLPITPDLMIYIHRRGFALETHCWSTGRCMASGEVFNYFYCTVTGVAIDARHDLLYTEQLSGFRVVIKQSSASDLKGYLTGIPNGILNYIARDSINLLKRPSNCNCIP